MSKTTLRKELLQLEKAQLIELILAVYGTSKETKEYFEFFIDPRPDELIDKFKEIIIKEFRRTRRGRYSKARISIIKGAIKRFSSFEPGNDYILRLYLFSIRCAQTTEYSVYFGPTLFNSICKLTEDCLKFANKTGQFSEALYSLTAFCNDSIGTKYFKNLIHQTITSFLENPANNVEKIR